jgi:hypothetical protein
MHNSATLLALLALERASLTALVSSRPILRCKLNFLHAGVAAFFISPASLSTLSNLKQFYGAAVRGENNKKIYSISSAAEAKCNLWRFCVDALNISEAAAVVCVWDYHHTVFCN